MFEDHWLLKPGGSIKNSPQLIEGSVTDTWHDYDYAYCRMTTGKIFRRHHCFLPSSPYGWEQLKGE